MSMFLLEGGNATGKSSLLENLTQTFPDYHALYSLDPSFEPLRKLAYKTWGDMPSFYYYLAGNLETLQKSARQKVFVDRSPFSSFAMYMARLDESQWPGLLPLFDQILQEMPPIHGVIHLTADTPTRRQRIGLKTGQARTADLEEIHLEDKKQQAREYLFAHAGSAVCTIDTSPLTPSEVSARAQAFVKAQQKTPTLTLLLGLPGAGKSTHCQQHYGPETSVSGQPERTVFSNPLILATDDLREQAHGSAFNPVIRQSVSTLLETKTLIALKQGRDVVIDSTYYNSRQARLDLYGRLSEALTFEYRLVGFKTDIELCIVRDSRREQHRRVGETVIRELALQYQLPQADEQADVVIL